MKLLPLNVRGLDLLAHLKQRHVLCEAYHQLT